MGAQNRNPRRFRVSRGFGRSPRFVLAVSQLNARLTAYRLEHATWRVIARLSHAA